MRQQSLHLSHHYSYLPSMHGVRTATGPGTFSLLVLECIVAVATWASIGSVATRDVLYSRYETKLESYNGNLPLFLLTTVPFVGLLVAVFLMHRTLSAISR